MNGLGLCTDPVFSSFASRHLHDEARELDQPGRAAAGHQRDCREREIEHQPDAGHTVSGCGFSGGCTAWGASSRCSGTKAGPTTENSGLGVFGCGLVLGDMDASLVRCHYQPGSAPHALEAPNIARPAPASSHPCETSQRAPPIWSGMKQGLRISFGAQALARKPCPQALAPPCRGRHASRDLEFYRFSRHLLRGRTSLDDRLP